VVEDKYVGLPSSEEARLKLPSWSELLGTTKPSCWCTCYKTTTLDWQGDTTANRAMQTAETYGRAVDTIFVFDESKAKHDVNEVEEKAAHGKLSQVTIVV
jgi:hypothetical protein